MKLFLLLLLTPGAFASEVRIVCPINDTHKVYEQTDRAKIEILHSDAKVSAVFLPDYMEDTVPVAVQGKRSRLNEGIVAYRFSFDLKKRTSANAAFGECDTADHLSYLGVLFFDEKNPSRSTYQLNYGGYKGYWDAFCNVINAFSITGISQEGRLLSTACEIQRIR